MPTTNDRAFAVEVVRRLREAGHQALWAGGCVRDLLLGVEPKDYDVATSAEPDQVQKVFRRTVPVGISFGVVRVLGTPGIEVEVATFRNDGQYDDGRRPNSVVYSTAEEDARRRDFTINGIFFDPIDEKVFDYVGGQADIAAHVIRAIGDPAERFTEDKLRMLRAARFAARLDFAIDPASAVAVRSMAKQLEVVSLERILAELQNMLTAPWRVRALDHLAALDLWSVALPELTGLLAPDAWTRTRKVLGHWPKPVSLPLAMAGLLTCTETPKLPKLADSMMRRLKGSNDDRERLMWLVAHRVDLDAADRARQCVLKRLFAHPGRDELIDLQEAWEASGRASDTSPQAKHCRKLLATWSPEEIDPLPLLTGDHLVASGRRPGPRFKEVLTAVRDAQLDGVVMTYAEAMAMVVRMEAADGRSSDK